MPAQSNTLIKEYMGKSISMNVGARIFEKKSDLVEYVQLFIKDYEPGQFLNEVDQSFCAELFKYHDGHANKIGAGIQTIEVRLDEYGHRFFEIHRLDGSHIDISWRHCITPKKK